MIQLSAEQLALLDQSVSKEMLARIDFSGRTKLSREEFNIFRLFLIHSKDLVMSHEQLLVHYRKAFSVRQADSKFNPALKSLMNKEIFLADQSGIILMAIKPAEAVLPAPIEEAELSATLKLKHIKKQLDELHTKLLATLDAVGRIDVGYRKRKLDIINAEAQKEEAKVKLQEGINDLATFSHTFLSQVEKDPTLLIADQDLAGSAEDCSPAGTEYTTSPIATDPLDFDTSSNDFEASTEEKSLPILFPESSYPPYSKSEESLLLAFSVFGSRTLKNPAETCEADLVPDLDGVPVDENFLNTVFRN